MKILCFILSMPKKKGLKNIANNLREIAHKLDEAAEEKKCVDIVNENWD